MQMLIQLVGPEISFITINSIIMNLFEREILRKRGLFHVLGVSPS